MVSKFKKKKKQIRIKSKYTLLKYKLKRSHHEIPSSFHSTFHKNIKANPPETAKAN